jgi:hypothetical protein
MRSAILASVVVVLAVVGVVLFRFTRHVKQEVLAEHATYVARRAAEATTREEAPWFGTTGLDDETERELAHYLRREFGEFLEDPTGLKARDLEYLGVQTDERGAAHFWRIAKARPDGPTYAYIDIDKDGLPLSYGWGDRAPPTPVTETPHE